MSQKQKQKQKQQKQKQAKAQAVPKVMRDRDVPSAIKLARLCREAEKEAEAVGVRVLALRTATEGRTLPPMEQAVTQRYEVLRDRLRGYVPLLLIEMPTLKRELEGRGLLQLVYKYSCALADIGGEAASGGARVVRGVPVAEGYFYDVADGYQKPWADHAAFWTPGTDGVVSVEHIVERHAVVAAVEARLQAKQPLELLKVLRLLFDWDGGNLGTHNHNLSGAAKR